MHLQQSLLDMMTTPSVAQLPIELADKGHRVSLTLARWLAYTEGMILLLGACMMVSSSAAGHSPNVAAGAAALSILSLTLGWKVGRGSAPAAIILLLLSISRGVATALPGAPEWWTTMPQITLLELIVFGLGVYAALSVKAKAAPRVSATRTYGVSASRPEAGSVALRPPAKPVASLSPALMESIVSNSSEADDPASRSRRLDVIVGGTVAVLSMMAMMTPVPHHAEGLQGFGEGLIVGLGMLDFLLAIMLLVSGHFARKGGRWGERIRRLSYFLIGSQALYGVKILFSVAATTFRH